MPPSPGLPLELTTATLDDPGPRPHRSRQVSFDDLGTPLSEVTFCVIDLETTGTDRETDAITEIGAVKYRGGERLGTLQTLVNPGTRIPARITVITGITQAMVVSAPRIDQVLPTLWEFIGESVLVGHNIGFDLGFLGAAARACDYEPLGNLHVDTLALARRLIRDEVPNLRLSTLCSRLRLANRSSHRALDDAMATADLLHYLLERATGHGVTGLDDLLALPKMAGHAQSHKLRLTAGLPRSPGVYLFGGPDGEVLYVGKATNLRSRVRSYFSSDERRRTAHLLRETRTLSHLECPGPLEPEVTELRLIRDLQPRYNRQGKRPSRPYHVKVTLSERFPRLSMVRDVKDDGSRYLGPIASRRQAALVVEALQTATRIRRCGRPSTRHTNHPVCSAAEIGRAACPCSGFTDPQSYDSVVTELIDLLDHPHLLLERLATRMNRLGEQERYEEAADIRDRAHAVRDVVARRRLIDGLRGAGRLVLRTTGGAGLVIEDGFLVSSRPGDSRSTRHLRAGSAPTLPIEDRDRGPIPASTVRPAGDTERLLIARWIRDHASELRIIETDHPLTSDIPRLPRFQPRRSGTEPRNRR